MFLCASVSHILYAPFHWWTFGLMQHLSYYELNCHEWENTDDSFVCWFHFHWLKSQVQDGQVIIDLVLHLWRISILFSIMALLVCIPTNNRIKCLHTIVSICLVCFFIYFYVFIFLINFILRWDETFPRNLCTFSWQPVMLRFFFPLHLLFVFHHLKKSLFVLRPFLNLLIFCC